MIRWILVRHGSHIKGQLGARGEEQVDQLRSALKLRDVKPTLYLVSDRPQAQQTCCRLRTELRCAPQESNGALTPNSPSAGLDALVGSTKAPLARETTVILIGHEGRLSNLLTELTGARHRPFPEAGAVCVTAGSMQDLLRGNGEIEFAMPIVDHQEAELRAKLDSKKTVAAVLAGFVLSALVAVLIEGPKPDERDLADNVAIVAFATSLALFVAAIYVYDQLAMPEGFWTDGSRTWLRRYIVDKATRRREHRWNRALAQEDPCGWRRRRRERWLRRRRKREALLREHGPIFPTMVSAWSWLFTPGVLAALVGFAGLLWDADLWVHALLVLGALGVGAVYLRRRPDLGAD